MAEIIDDSQINSTKEDSITTDSDGMYVEQTSNKHNKYRVSTTEEEIAAAAAAKAKEEAEGMVIRTMEVNYIDVDWPSVPSIVPQEVYTTEAVKKATGITSYAFGKANNYWYKWNLKFITTSARTYHFVNDDGETFSKAVHDTSYSHRIDSRPDQDPPHVKRIWWD